MSTEDSNQSEGSVDKRNDAAAQRDASSERRDIESALRDGAADSRDTLAASRDRAAKLRDQAADDRDAATARARASESATESAPEAFMRSHAAADRKWSSESRFAAEIERAEASHDRAHASQNRNASMLARGESAVERDLAAAQRIVSAKERASAAMDGLTGAYLRGPGLIEVEREIERAGRTNAALVLAFIDVDSLKTINDVHGHAAGDRLLRSVVRMLGEKLRLYDRIVRYGGDEFVCALSDMTEADAAARLTEVNASLLAAASDPGSITFGLAAMVAGDTVDTLIERADRALYRKRGAA